jgi:hypothetical protein
MNPKLPTVDQQRISNLFHQSSSFNDNQKSIVIIEINPMILPNGMDLNKSSQKGTIKALKHADRKNPSILTKIQLSNLSIEITIKITLLVMLSQLSNHSI